MNIKGKIVTLRAIEKEDNKLMKDMLNDPEIENLVVGWALPISNYEQNKWYESSIEDKNNLRFIIETSVDGAVGLATLTNIDWKNRTATHGIKLANKKYGGRGIGIDTVMTIMRYAFDELQLHRLDGGGFDDNEASKCLYMRCGWSVEGKKRECIYKRGKYHDLLVIGILANDYYNLIENEHYWDR